MSPDEQEALSSAFAPKTFGVFRLRSGRWAIYDRHGRFLSITDDPLSELNRLSDHYVPEPYGKTTTLTTVSLEELGL